MSGRWDWDVKSSYTYHALKKAKDEGQREGRLEGVREGEIHGRREGKIEGKTFEKKRDM